MLNCHACGVALTLESVRGSPMMRRRRHTLSVALHLRRCNARFSDGEGAVVTPSDGEGTVVTLVPTAGW